MTRGLYIHIPFCARKCFYCDFVITVKHAAGDRARFLSVLEKDLAQAARRYRHLSFATLYFGGGTPSLLTPDELRRIMAAIRHQFIIVPDAEITLELNPDDASEEKLRAFRKYGINRISIGVQSFNDRLLQQMGRLHDAEGARRALRLIRETGFTNVSADLILRLPEQTAGDVRDSVGELIKAGVSQVVLYDLDVHEKTVYGLRQRQGRLPLPEEPLHREMFSAALTALENAGFAQYEVSSFARPGFESKHNLIYWRNQDYLGLGPGAFSYLDGTRSQFAGNTTRYLEKCAADDWQPDTAEIISPHNRQVETLLTGLRLAEGIDLAQLPDLRNRLAEALPPFMEKELVQLKENRLSMTREGRFIAETILSALVTPCLDSGPVSVSPRGLTS